MGMEIVTCMYFLAWIESVSFYFSWIQGVTRCVNEAGIGFMMAPIYHPAMKIVGPVRKKLKVKTVFNILGPMLNPARVPFAVVGVFSDDLVSASILSIVGYSS